MENDLNFFKKTIYIYIILAHDRGSGGGFRVGRGGKFNVRSRPISTIDV